MMALTREIVARDAEALLGRLHGASDLFAFGAEPCDGIRGSALGFNARSGITCGRTIDVTRTATLLFLCFSAAGYGSALGDEIHTLYRTSTLAPMRVHVATFDAQSEHAGYNRGNCEMVVKFLSQQPGVPVGYYWCEPGRFRAEHSN